jgi:hypothetical protein
MTQAVQVFIQNRILTRSLASTNRSHDLPFLFKAIRHMTILQRLPARMFGLGFRPEHVDPLIARRPNRPIS